MKKHKRRNKVKLWEWILSILITALAAIIVWTNESIDLLTKFKIIVEPGMATLIFLGITFIGASWILINLLRHKRLI